MDSILKISLIKETMPNIIKALSVFAYNNKHEPNVEDLCVGELYTLIRRHLPHLTTTTYNVTKYNIERIYIKPETGEILWINFLKDSRVRGCYKEEVINSLNDILEEINPNYGQLVTIVVLEKITNSIENYQLIKQ